MAFESMHLTPYPIAPPRERWFPSLARVMEAGRSILGVSGVCLMPTSDVRAVLGVATRIAGAPVGSLNVVRPGPSAWDEDDIAAVEAHNRIVESVLEAAVAARRTGRIVEQLEEALDRRVPIERSVGMLMGRYGLDAGIEVPGIGALEE